MADDQEKTEEPTDKKIEDARKEGNVPKSQDTSGVITLFVAILAILMLFPFIAERMLLLFKYYFSLVGTPLDKFFMLDIAIVTFKEVLLMVIPLAISVAIAGVIAALAQFGFLFTTKAIATDLKKIDPIKGTKNLFSMKKLIEGIKVTFKSLFTFSKFSDVSKDLMKLRMIKSSEEIDIIKNGARIADIGAEEIVKHIKVGASELEIATVGRDKMEMEIAKTYPEAEYMDTWVWFQSGINTDGAHNPKTSRKLKSGEILSLNTFPMISGYYTALERTLFLNEIDDASLKAWEANITVHKKGLELIKPGAKCSEICKELNDLFFHLGYLQYRTFGYGHSFGILSHFYGRESGLELSK